MRIISATVPALALLLAAGCHADRDTAEAPAPAAAPTEAAAPAAEDADVTMRYACEGDTTVAILAGDQARVSLPNGLIVHLSRIADSKPPVFQGVNLYFAVGETDAHLSQEDGTELTCRPQ